MGLARDDAGNVWETDANGKPIRLAQQARQGGVFSLPEAPDQDKAIRSQLLQLQLQQKLKEAKAGEASVAPSDLSGAAYLKTLDPGTRAMVQALSEGRKSFPTGAGLRAPYWQNMLQHVANYDPGFDEVNYTSRAATRRDFTAGTAAKNIRALNTAIGHLGHLATQIDGTASHGGFPFATTVNAVQNAFERGKGDPGITNYETTSSALAGELTAVYRGSGGAEADIQRYLKDLNPNASQAQKSAAIGNIMTLLKSRLDALNDQYLKGMGTTAKPLELLNPESEKLLKAYSAPDVGSAPPSGPTPPPSGPGGGLAPSSNGYSDKPNPAASAFWEAAARNRADYRSALDAYQKDASSRGNTVVEPPSPEQYRAVVDYMRKNPNTEYHPFESVTRTPLTGTSAVMNDVAQNPGGAFAGHYYNQFFAGLPGAVAGDEGQYFNSVSRQQNPNASLIGDVAGTVGGAVNTGKLLGKAAPYIGKVGEFLTKTPARQALTGDLLFGGTTGAAENPDHPFLGAGLGAGSMLAGNVAGRYVLGPAFQAVASTQAGQGLINAAMRAAGRGSERFVPPAPLDPGQNMVMGSTKNAVDGIRQNLTDAADLGLPYSLADSNPKLRLLAGSATRKSPDVRALAESVIGPRSLGQGERATAQINSSLAPVGDVPTLQGNLLKQARSESAPLYSEAKSQPVPDLTANPALKEVLDRPAAQSAIRKGYETALNNGEDVGTLTYATDASGNQVQYGNPSWNVIHYARQALDDSGEAAVRHALDKQISGINPGFKAADAKYAGIMKGSDALQGGADATGIRVTPEATQRALAGFPNNGAQFRQGYASQMADLIERAKAATNAYNVVNGSMGQQAKLATIFPEGAPRFNRAQALEGDMSKTAAETLGGSPTQPRAEADRMFDSGLGDAAADIGISMATGGVPSPLSIARLATKFADVRALGIRGAKARADSIGPILLNPDPQASLAQLDLIQRMYAARQAYGRQTKALGGAIGAPVIFGLTQPQ